MRNLLTKTTDLAMYVTLSYVERGDCVIDATCGNGGDTIALSAAVGEEGRVLALDIQQSAVEYTRNRLAEANAVNAAVRQGSFLHMDEILQAVFPGNIPSAIVFNLGYLPGGDKSITTKAEETEAAVRRAADLVRLGGVVTVVLYSGHPEGAREKRAVLAMAERLPKEKYHAVFASMSNQTGAPPEILWITRKR